MFKAEGRHFLSTLYGVKDITNLDKLRSVFEKALEKSGANICSKSEHTFNDLGFTCVWLLKESHCSIHTYVDEGIIFVDLFSCGDSCDNKIFENLIICNLEMEKSVSKRIKRD
jgi:S-adenosylmethionine decarboxylase proenzyme